MSLLRPSLRLSQTGLGLGSSRAFHTSRIAAIQSSRVSRDAVVSAEETGGFKYVPGGPILKGTVNDASTFPTPSKSHGSYHWAFERLLSASLIPVMGAAAVSTGSAYPVLDGILGISLIVHSHIGFDSVIVDYVHARKFPIMGPLAAWALRVATGLSVWGVYEFNTNDVGLTELVKRTWTA